jgi:hypothetical protein
VPNKIKTKTTLSWLGVNCRSTAAICFTVGLRILKSWMSLRTHAMKPSVRWIKLTRRARPWHSRTEPKINPLFALRGDDKSMETGHNFDGADFRAYSIPD